MGSRTDRVEAVARRYVEKGAYASIEWLVVRDGAEWLRGQVGMADPLNGIAIPQKPIYRLYSMTKPVVSAIAMMLLEEGRLRLYDPVSSFLPAFRNMQIIDEAGTLRPARSIMTVEQLLSHRSGLTYGFLTGCPAAARYRQTDLGRTAPPLEQFVDFPAPPPQ